MCNARVLGSLVLAVLVSSEARAQVTVLASVDSNGAQGDGASGNPALSDDGRFVAFASTASTFGGSNPGGLQNVFLRDRVLGTTAWISAGLHGAQPDGSSWDASISADGRWVAFASDATNLAPGDGNGLTDVFVCDTVQLQSACASLGPAGEPANDVSLHPRISADGRHVVFLSYATNLVPGIPGGTAQVYVRDLDAQTTVCASVGANGAAANADAFAGAISRDGGRVVFWSRATNLLPGADNGVAHVYLRDLAAGSTVRVSVDSNGVLADGDSQPAALSSDGTRVAFASVATNLVAGDTNGASDVFLRDLATGQTVRVSVATGGGQSNGDSLAPSISASGDKIAFESSATNLVGNDTNGSWDIFWRDLGTGLTRRASIDSSSAQSNGSSHDPAISGDSRQVAFDSEATNLVAGDGNGQLDVFVRAAAAPSVAFCFGDGTEAIGCPCSNVGAAGRGCENSAATGGALLGAEGTTQPDTLVLNVTGELPHALSLFLESREVTDAALFLGDGLRCLGGPPKRLYAHRATAGSVSAPADGELAISARSAELGDVIAPGTTRFYQVYYRDPAPGFCPAPLGNTINTSNALRVYW